ncbi:hypothetical protein [Paenibacillus barengoltzii]|uniref:Uncharacterized protein n=1 Tax=Paenibacillus barengoltzii J12 TaxID=935846 RepID=A0ABY1LYG5_9BACL|nr:hypothetical protein [Paenibacillus barengoltzii]SMF33539.1 hypothetical protein SAMN02744124_02501 [Paenibacillus barengoltzii J12]
MTDFQELSNQIAQFKKQINSWRYAGELCLDEDELTSFSTALRKYQFTLDREDYDIAILVLAVNIAYYFYDDDGFWHHFSKVTGIENTEMTGRAIERTLRRYGKLSVQRYGPFRYVGAILEQCGISRRYIPSFTFILKELKRLYRGDRILELKYSDLIDFLKDFNCAKYLKEFLLDEEGARLTLQVLRIIKMYEEGVINKDELASLDGFRPGFWDEVLKHYRVIPQERKADVFYNKPALRLDLSGHVLELFFPSRSFIDGMEDRERFSYPVTKLDNASELQEKYCGRVAREGGQALYWEIPGWLPKGLPVLFDCNKRTMIPGNLTIYPGMYYLLAPAEYVVPEDKVVSFLGELKLSLNSKYYIYKITLNYGDKLSHLKIASKPEASRVFIQFKNPEMYSFPFYDGHVDIFVGDMPDLEVSDFGPIKNNTVGLFYDFGRIKGRIRNEEDLHLLKGKIKANLPLKGRIWSEVIVRNSWEREQRLASELLFYVVPYIKIKGYDRFFGFGVKPTLQIEKSTNLNLIMDGATVEGDKYTFSARSRVVEGKIMINEDTIEFQIPLKRVGILDENGRVLRYIEQSELAGRRFVFVGPPKTELHLHFQNDQNLTFHLDDKGRAFVKGELLQTDSIGKKGGVPLYGEIGAELFPLGCWLIDSESIFSIPDISGLAGSAALNELLQLVSLIKKGPLQQKIQIKKLPEITKTFNNKLREFFCCAQVFDETVFVMESKVINWIEILEDGPLKSILEAYRLGQWREELSSCQIFLPKVERWAETLGKHMKNFSPDQLYETLREWAAEVNAHRFVGISSSLGKLDYGQALTHAWVSYQKYNVLDALGRLNDVSEECPGLTGYLSKFLKVIIYVRQARFRQAKSLMEPLNPEPAEMSELHSLLQTLVHTLNGEIMTTDYKGWQNNNVKLLLKILPLTREDHTLLDGYHTYLCNGDIGVIVRCSEDWLYNWLLLCLLEDDDPLAAEIASSLLNLVATIPPSLEKGTIMEKVNNRLKRS